MESLASIETESIPKKALIVFVWKDAVQAKKLETSFQTKTVALPKRTTLRFLFAERKGFEPSIRCRIHAFQACALSRSATFL